LLRQRQRRLLDLDRFRRRRDDRSRRSFTCGTTRGRGRGNHEGKNSLSTGIRGHFGFGPQLLRRTWVRASSANDSPIRYSCSIAGTGSIATQACCFRAESAGALREPTLNAKHCPARGELARALTRGLLSFLCQMHRLRTAVVAVIPMLAGVAPPAGREATG